MRVADWLDRVIADAERRGLTGLVPLLQTLARSTDALRAADAEFGHPAAFAPDGASAPKAADHHDDH